MILSHTGERIPSQCVPSDLEQHARRTCGTVNSKHTQLGKNLPHAPSIAVPIHNGAAAARAATINSFSATKHHQPSRPSPHHLRHEGHILPPNPTSLKHITTSTAIPKGYNRHATTKETMVLFNTTQMRSAAFKIPALMTPPSAPNPIILLLFSPPLT